MMLTAHPAKARGEVAQRVGLDLGPLPGATRDEPPKQLGDEPSDAPVAIGAEPSRPRSQTVGRQPDALP